MNGEIDCSLHREAVQIAGGVHWIGALDPTLRSFDIIHKTANGTTYNAYLVRGGAGVAVIDTVKEGFEAELFARLESVAHYEEIQAVMLNHLEPDHSGPLPELMRRAPQARLSIPVARGSPARTQAARAPARAAHQAHPHRRRAVGLSGIWPEHRAPSHGPRGREAGDRANRSILPHPPGERAGVR